MGIFKKELYQENGLVISTLYLMTAITYFNLVIDKKNTGISYKEIFSYLKNNRKPIDINNYKNEASYFGLLEIFLIQHFSFFFYKHFHTGFSNELKNINLLFTQKNKIESALFTLMMGTKLTDQKGILFVNNIMQLLAFIKNRMTVFMVNEAVDSFNLPSILPVKICVGLHNILYLDGSWNIVMDEAVDVLSNNQNLSVEFQLELKNFLKGQDEKTVNVISNIAVNYWSDLSKLERFVFLENIINSVNKFVIRLNEDPHIGKDLFYLLN